MDDFELMQSINCGYFRWLCCLMEDATRAVTTAGGNALDREAVIREASAMVDQFASFSRTRRHAVIAQACNPCSAAPAMAGSPQMPSSPTGLPGPIGNQPPALPPSGPSGYTPPWQAPIPGTPISQQSQTAGCYALLKSTVCQYPTTLAALRTLANAVAGLPTYGIQAQAAAAALQTIETACANGDWSETSPTAYQALDAACRVRAFLQVVAAIPLFPPATVAAGYLTWKLWDCCTAGSATATAPPGVGTGPMTLPTQPLGDVLGDWFGGIFGETQDGSPQMGTPSTPPQLPQNGGASSSGVRQPPAPESHAGAETGGAIGTGIGAAIGSELGPVGTVVGGAVGGALGEWVGGWFD